MSLLYLRREDAGYVSDGAHYTAGQAADLIEPFPFATVSKFDRSLIAGDSREQVARYGKPRFAPDIAQEIYRPDWYCTMCGCSGTVDDEDCGHGCEYQGIGVHK